jgi:acylphosphatase
MMKHISIKVYGLVQGVFFRASTREKAEELGVKGIVRNEPDDTVYIEAEGDDETLATFQAWCKQGPRRASVSRIECSEGAIKGYKSFSIER